MNVLLTLWRIWCTHGSKVLGFVIGTISALASAGVIPESHLKFWMAAIAVLTFWRGYCFPAPTKESK